MDSKKTRTDVLNHLIERYNIQSYCELGTQLRSANFDKIKCTHKYCVDDDTAAQADFVGTTDSFFTGLKAFFDLFFIDASHYAWQVRTDFINATMHLSDKGIIVLHDCSPDKEEHTITPRPTERGHWNGSVYKFAIQIQDKYTVDIDNGCLVWRSTFGKVITDFECDWEHFNTNRKELLNLISWDEFVRL
jgi:hypothetical protein